MMRPPRSSSQNSAPRRRSEVATMQLTQKDIVGFAKVIHGFVAEVAGLVKARLDGHEARLAALDTRLRELEARPPLKYMGAWSANEPCHEGEFYQANGNLWYCKMDSHGVRPGTNPDVWTLA